MNSVNIVFPVLLFLRVTDAVYSTMLRVMCHLLQNCLSRYYQEEQAGVQFHKERDVVSSQLVGLIV